MSGQRIIGYPLQANETRHAIIKLENQDAHTKITFLASYGQPQDRGYRREGVEKEYAVHDTHITLVEARQKSIAPFCLTVDKAEYHYLKSMCGDSGPSPSVCPCSTAT